MFTSFLKTETITIQQKLRRYIHHPETKRKLGIDEACRATFDRRQPQIRTLLDPNTTALQPAADTRRFYNGTEASWVISRPAPSQENKNKLKLTKTE